MAKTFEQLVPAPKGRFDGISRPYSPAEVERLRGSVPIAYTLAEKGANRLWESLKNEPYVNSLGAVTGNQAMQQARAGLQAIYLSGWQVAADANTAGAMYPDQSLYPANAGPELCRRINRTFQRADQIEHSEGGAKIDWFVPIVADAEAGFGGPLNSFEIMKAYIEAGAAGVHFEDQLASEKKCGHMGGKVLIPTAAHERNLIAARLAADVCGMPTFVLARTDAESAKLITSDVDERDREFITGERTAEGFFRLKPGTGLAHCIKRGIAFANYADLLWWETSTPNLDEAQRIRRGRAQGLSGQDAGLQLLAVVQLGSQYRQGDHRQVPARDRRDGLQVPVRDAGGLPLAQPRHVRTGARLQGRRHGGLFPPAAGRVRLREARLFGDAPPARGRHRLFRPGVDHHHRRHLIDHGAARLDRSRAVQGARFGHPHSGG